MYPFGKEESASLERLFWFFCECVKRGDWELAQACIPQLHQWKEEGSEKVETILHALIVCPFRLRCGANHSPQKLAWFWLLVLQKWLAWEQKTVPVALQKETEFLLLLEELEKDVPHSVLKELYEAFQDRHTLNRKQRDGSVHKFSVEVLSALQKMLLQAPRRLQAMLELLQSDPAEGGSSLAHSFSLQHIFIGFLWDSLKLLKHLQLNPELSESDWSEAVDKIYNALSLLNLEVENQTGELRLLFRELLDACWLEWRPLREERLLSCLLRKDSRALLSLFGSVFVEKTREKLLGLKSPGKGTSEQLDAERAVMALFLDHEQAYSWKAAYFYCLSSNKHFLEQILITALTLLKREDFSSLSSLLRQEFSHLSRLLILLGWTQCRSLESAKMLLWTLHKSQGFCNDSVLKDFCDGLYAQVDVLEWCIQQNRNIIPEKVLLQHLHSLECHSSLYLLHHFTNLLALNEEDVIELLQKSPVRDIEFQDSTVMPISSRLSQQRNLVLFQAFCAMKYTIYALCVNAHRDSNCKDCASCFVSDLHDELPDQNKPADQPLYPDYVGLFAEYLAKCQHFLRTVPVPLRLELLENIFSLLFISYSDLGGDDPQEEEKTEDGGFEKKSCAARRLERCASQGSSTSASPQHSARPRRRPAMHTATATQERSNIQVPLDSESNRNNCTSFRRSYLDLKHFTAEIHGFLVDDVAMEIFLQMLLDHLKEIEGSSPWDSKHVPQEELALLDCMNLSVNRDSFGCRVQLFSKYLSEAQWRYKIVLSNRNAGNQCTPIRISCNLTRGSNVKRQMRSQRRRPDCKKGISGSLAESTSSELSITSASEGSASTLSDWSDVEYRIKPQKNVLIPMMLSPPESLLVACILRGNYIEAHQVAIMFSLESSASYGELIFLERYQEVIRELAKVEHKIDHQSSEGPGNLKQSGSGRSTLKAIGNAAAAGMVFYSISDVTDKLLAPSEGLVVPMLQESFWTSGIQLEHTNPLSNVLEGLCPSAMAIFDLASTQCHLWKTCKQLLETAERRLYNSLEMKGRRLDSVLQPCEGMRGFPAVLQQISKIVNTSQGQPKSEISDENISSHFYCSIADLLQTCYPAVTVNCITNQIVLSQHFDQILQKLEHVEDFSDSKGNLLASFIEQASLKPAELEVHPVYKEIKLLLGTLDRHAHTMQESHMQNVYVQRFFEYINRLAAIIFRSVTPELDQSAEVRVGNPFILLQQTPCHLLSQLLFEKQVVPDRLSSLLAKEELNLNVQQVIINCCCKPLPLCNTRRNSLTRSLLTNISSLAHLHAYHCLPDVEVPVHNPAMDSEDASSHPSSSPPDQNQHMFTASTLSFLKSQSKLTATMACLSASKVQKTPKQSLSWMEFRGKREGPLSIEQISKECEALLKGFPFLESFLLVMSEPLQDPQDEGNGLASGLCGKSYISLLFLGLHSVMAAEALMEVFEQALTAADWSRALKVLDLYSQDVEELITVRDAVLSCATADGKEGWRYLFRVRDAMLRSRLALRYLDRWPLEACLEILAYCACDPEVSEELRSDLQNKTRELQVYQKILCLQDVPVWHDWQDLKRACTDDSQAVIEMILEAKDYVLCEEWGNLYFVPRDHLISLHQEHLLHLLEMGDIEKALQLLQRIEDPDIQLVITEQCLDKHPSLAASHFLADYLTTYFYKHLTVTRHNEIQALYMGSKVLLTLPDPSRASYSHLSCKPLLMLEQLLMNMKVDWAAVAIQTVHQHLIGQEIGFTVEDIDALLSKYAGKALDFPFSLKEKRSDSVIQIPESLYQGSESDTLSKSESVEKFPASYPDTPCSSSPRDRSLPRTVSSQEFVPPEKPPAKQQWIPDETEVTCMVCKTERFTMFNRRHHCRRCGRLVCSSCSSKKMVVESCRENPARVCDQCYSYYNREGSTVLPQDAEISKEMDQDQEKGESHSDDGCSDYSAVVQVPKMTELEWLLSLREEENEIVRGEFYYEQAPSASLCIAIFNLHSNSIACGHQLIEHCCRLSQGLTNPEVDAGLLTDIMKQLLFSAKMMFVKAGRSQDLALCDSYISKVDVLNILVAAAYRRVPSLDQILQPAAVTRLRNQLLEAEYYELAVEVSTKTGLDPAGAWHAWGMACLKAGNLTAAREKFSRCLKPPLDLNQLNLGSRMVKDVVQYLESTVKPILSVQDDDYFATLRELEVALRTRSLSLEMTPEGKIQNNTYYQECLFYLHNYGTNLAIIGFYMRHDCTREALLHLLNKESPQEVFIEGIFVPSYKSGKLHMLENLLETIDPGLESWGVYLIAACKHLQKKNYYHILYELQQFMKDQVRAAMTCIRFFTHKAKSYTELGERQKWLLKVKDHLKIYLQEVSRSSGRKKVTCTFRKKMHAPDVSRHINTVELQMEVTKFLHQCEKLGASSVAATSVPTLFGNNQMKMEVACKVMLEGKNIEEGFGIAFRVLQDFQLEAATVYNKVARQLVKQQNYSEIRQLLKCIKESGAADKNDGDNVILNCLDEFDSIPAEELDNLIQDMDSDENKIQAYLRCHKLRSAYLVSVKQENTRAVQLVQHVRQLAEDSGEDVVQAICTQWLSVHHTKPRSWLTQSTKK